MDRFFIYHLFLGFIPIPYRENLVSVAGYVDPKGEVCKIHNSYGTFDDAANALKKYREDGVREYKGHRLVRCHNDIFVDFSSDFLSCGLCLCGLCRQYTICGSFEHCKELIDERLRKIEICKFEEKIYL